jgi:hypothetical protein
MNCGTMRILVLPSAGLCYFLISLASRPCSLCTWTCNCRRDKGMGSRKVNSTISSTVSKLMGENYSFPWDTRYPAMDHEKPEAVVPQGIEYYPTEQARSPVTPDIEYAGPPSINEAEDVEDRKNPRGDSVWYSAHYQRGSLSLIQVKENFGRKTYQCEWRRNSSDRMSC